MHSLSQGTTVVLETKMIMNNQKKSVATGVYIL
eukprot:UN19582